MLVAASSMVQAQGSNPRRVLFEEFTNTGCGPCAASDPMVEEFESADLSNICVLKYHVSWPDGADPFYLYTKSVEGANGIDPRLQTYYGMNSVPYVRFCGGRGSNPYPGADFNTAADMKTVADSVNALMSPYTMTITQSITADSILADVTVNAIDAVPTLADLRLAVVFAEQYNPYHGTNKRPFYTSIVRKVVPGLAATGAINITARYPAFSLAMGTNKTYHYAAKLGSTWNLSQMMAVAFIQSAGTKEVFQAAWTVPDVIVTGDDQNFLTFPIDQSSAPNWTVTNLSKTTSVKVKATIGGAIPAGWNLTATGLDPDGTITLAPSGSKTLSLTGAAGATAVGYADILLNVMDAFGVGITARQAGLLGTDTKDLVVDASGNTAQANDIASNLTASGYKADAMPEAPLYDANQLALSWGQFDHILYNLGPLDGQLNNANNMTTFVGAYVQGGGKLLLSATNIEDDYYKAYVQQGNDIFLTSMEANLGLEPKLAGATKWTAINGIAGDPISNGFNTTLSGSLAKYAKLGLGDPAAMPIFLSNKGDTIGIRAELGNGKVVVLGFSVDTVAKADRVTLLNRIMAYFDGSAAVNPSSTPSGVTLQGNYPNPLAASTTISYVLPDHRYVTLVVRDMMGREVATLVAQNQEAGRYAVPFDASHLANGTYIYSLTAGDVKAEGKMTVSR